MKDKGLRKFQAMVIGLSFALVGFVLTGWNYWPQWLFDAYCWVVFGLVAGFKASNVSEKIWGRFKKTQPGAKP